MCFLADRRDWQDTKHQHATNKPQLRLPTRSCQARRSCCPTHVHTCPTQPPNRPPTVPQLSTHQAQPTTYRNRHLTSQQLLSGLVTAVPLPDCLPTRPPPSPPPVQTQHPTTVNQATHQVIVSEVLQQVEQLRSGVSRTPSSHSSAARTATSQRPLPGRPRPPCRRPQPRTRPAAVAGLCGGCAAQQGAPHVHGGAGGVLGGDVEGLNVLRNRQREGRR